MYLQRGGVWGRISTKLVPVDNVRAALAAVESGNIDCGIVYRTDALISSAVRIAFEVPRGEAPEISYPAAVIRTSRNRAAAQRFLDFLSSPFAKKVFERYGFVVK
jgi:molybdate transport system substrate-binding protein